MNAPWKGSGQARDQFCAYMCDETSLDVVRQITIEMGWPPEKCHRGGLRSAVQSLSVSASPNILMIDLSESGDPLSDINALAEVCEPGTIVIAVGQVNDVRLYRDLLASGIHDYLLKPLSQGQVRDAIGQAQAVFAAPRHGDGDARRHLSTAVIGTRGGIGASTIATSLAWLMSTEDKFPTALLDLDIHFGTGALCLDLEPGRGLADAIETPSRIDGLFIERAMIRANDNLAILSAEAPITAPLLTDGSAFLQLLEEFKQAFDMSVIDLPRNILINFPQLLAEVNVIVLVVEMTLASARDTIRILSWLRSNASHTQILIVANKVQPAMAEISKSDFEASIETRIDHLIPYDLKATSTAAKLGQTLVDAAKTSKASAVIHDLERAVVATSAELSGKTEAAPKTSLLGKFDLKSLMPKAAAKKAGVPAR
ncbi:CpaE family protein [Novosphingobium sp. 9]|uniref:AAA family ATPase n=1 Tax=Novosphingobium sp. 9 TaxID=2025349 RepID=UPI0021B4F3B1|nr:pilus assembly protein CpaE [Novosphingobium sp. 9]